MYACVHACMCVCVCMYRRIRPCRQGRGAQGLMATAEVCAMTRWVSAVPSTPARLDLGREEPNPYPAPLPGWTWGGKSTCVDPGCRMLVRTLRPSCMERAGRNQPYDE